MVDYFSKILNVSKQWRSDQDATGQAPEQPHFLRPALSRRLH